MALAAARWAMTGGKPSDKYKGQLDWFVFLVPAFVLHSITLRIKLRLPLLLTLSKHSIHTEAPGAVGSHQVSASQLRSQDKRSPNNSMSTS